MGVATGCGCKEVYRFSHITYPYSSCICSFLQQHPYFLFNVFRSLYDRDGAAKRTDTRGVGISSMRKSIYSAGHQESRKCNFSHNVHFLSHTS